MSRRQCRLELARDQFVYHAFSGGCGWQGGGPCGGRCVVGTVVTRAVILDPARPSSVW